MLESDVGETPVMEKVRESWRNLEHVPQPDRSKEVVMAAVSQDWGALQYCHPCNDLDIMRVAVEQDPLALQFASDSLRKNAPLVCKALQRNGLLLEEVHEDLQADREVVMAAVTENGLALEFASCSLTSDREVVAAAVASAPLALQFAAEELQGDRELALAAVQGAWQALHFVPFAHDPDIALAAVVQSADALELLDSEALTREVLTAAVKKGKTPVLNSAPQEFLADKEFMTACVAVDGLALQHASEALRTDKDLCLAALAQTRHSKRFVCQALWLDDAFVKEASAAIDAARQRSRMKRVALRTGSPSRHSAAP